MGRYEIAKGEEGAAAPVDGIFRITVNVPGCYLPTQITDKAVLQWLTMQCWSAVQKFEQVHPGYHLEHVGTDEDQDMYSKNIRVQLSFKTVKGNRAQLFALKPSWRHHAIET